MLYLENQCRPLSPNYKHKWSNKTKRKTEKHYVNWTHLDSCKDCQKSGCCIASVKDCCNEGSFRFWKVKLTFHSKSCDVQTKAHIHSDIQYVEKAHLGHKNILQNFLFNPINLSTCTKLSRQILLSYSKYQKFWK